MDGVTILNIIEHRPSLSVWVPLICFIGMYLLTVTSEIFDNDMSESIKYICKELAFVLLVLAFISLMVFINDKSNEMTKYEVTIDDSIDMVEFNRKYEILEQRGKIFVVTEREEDE